MQLDSIIVNYYLSLGTESAESAVELLTHFLLQPKQNWMNNTREDFKYKARNKEN